MLRKCVRGVLVYRRPSVRLFLIINEQMACVYARGVSHHKAGLY